jgi:hypothetical protein
MANRFVNRGDQISREVILGYVATAIDFCRSLSDYRRVILTD